MPRTIAAQNTATSAKVERCSGGRAFAYKAGIAFFAGAPRAIDSVDQAFRP